MKALTPARQRILERVIRLDGRLQELQVTASGGRSVSDLRWLIAEGLVEIHDHPTVKGRNGQPAAALKATQFGLGAGKTAMSDDDLSAPRFDSARFDPEMSMAVKPRPYVKNRAARLARLVELNAPYLVLRNEFLMLLRAMSALHALEGDNPQKKPDWPSQ